LFEYLNSYIIPMQISFNFCKYKICYIKCDSFIDFYGIYKSTFLSWHVCHFCHYTQLYIKKYVNKNNVTMGLSVWWISVLLIQLHEHPCITNTLYVALIEYTGYNRKDCNGLQIERNIKRKSKKNKRKKENSRKKIQMMDAVHFTSCTMNHCFCMFMRNWKLSFCAQTFLLCNVSIYKSNRTPKKIRIILPPLPCCLWKAFEKIERWVCIYKSIKCLQ
jgi:hypothetical protein